MTLTVQAQTPDGRIVPVDIADLHALYPTHAKRADGVYAEPAPRPTVRNYITEMADWKAQQRKVVAV
jgi:hypothetical protein